MAKRSTVKRIIIVMNIIVFVVGAMVFSCGLFIRFGSGLVGADVVTMLGQIKFSGSTSVGVVLDVIDYFMLVAGAALMAFALFGMYAAWKKIKGCLILYGVMAVLMLMVQVVTLGLWITLYSETDEWFKGELMDLLTSYHGPQVQATDEISKGFNQLFIQAQCCAVNAYESATSNDFANQPAIWWSLRMSDQVPASCCHGVTEDNMRDYISSSCTVGPGNYYTEGCYPLIRRYVRAFTVVLAVAAGLLLIAEVVAIVSACLLVNKLSNRITTVRGKDQRPPPYVGIDAVTKKRTRK